MRCFTRGIDGDLFVLDQDFILKIVGTGQMAAFFTWVTFQWFRDEKIAENVD